jgi:type II secretory pathway pseudopilin PulG
MDSGKEPNYWPGFVDALSNVVLTLVFVLVIFVFALLMASQKVKAKMAEVQQAEKGQQASQAQLNQALAQLEQMRAQESSEADKNGSPASASASASCVKFNKSDATQHVEADPDGTSIIIFFSPNAISVTDDTAKAINDFIETYRTKTSESNTRFTIDSTSDPNAVSPLMAKETQLGRMLNVRNSLLAAKVEPHNISIHTIDPLQQKDSYNWVKVYVQK